jgi:hypothetical protein
MKAGVKISMKMASVVAIRKSISINESVSMKKASSKQ